MNTHDAMASIAQMPDRELLARVKELSQREREATADLIAHLAELDERRLYLPEGYASLFKYCTDVLHLSEHSAYNRIEAARAVRRFPVILEHLATGSVTLFAVRLLAPHLTQENHNDVLARARHKSTREIEELIAGLRPQPPVPDMIRRLPASTPSLAPLQIGAECAPTPTGDGGGLGVVVAPGPAPTHDITSAHRGAVTPLAPERYKVTFTAGGEFRAKLREAQALLRHQIPDGSLEEVFDRALEALLATLRKKKLAATDRPRGLRAPSPRAIPHPGPDSRHIPAAVRRAVWARDGGRCAFVSATGQRCPEIGFLQFHHVVPYAAGGPSTVENIELRCPAHNRYEAERQFGRWRPSDSLRNELPPTVARPGPHSEIARGGGP